MKVAINVCYGGFSLSGETICKIGERKGYEVFTYCRDWEDEKYIKIRPHYAEYFVTKDFGDEVGSDEEDAFFDAILPSFLRTDPDLIAVIEEMGEDANGTGSFIKIVEIPDDVDWEIDEYDGREWIAEKHRRWS